MKKVTIILLAIFFTVVLTVPALATGGYVEGGGHLVESFENTKRRDWHVVSFGGWTDAASMTGEWQVNFHNVGKDAVDDTKFHGTNVIDINFFTSNDPSCESAMNLTVEGEWNHMPGYKVILRSGDGGSPGRGDTVRVELWQGEPYTASGTLVYDTHSSGEFTDESNCRGGARTGLDAGNFTIVP